MIRGALSGCLLLAGLLVMPGAMAASRYYDIEPVEVAADTYVVFGAQENFNDANHGAIANTGFIVTDEGVVVIDTGPSRLYGQALREAIGRITEQPVVQVYISHAHPDHFLGNNAFDDVPIAALPGTIDAVRAVGSDLAGNLYNLVGAAMRGTSAVVPDQAVESGTTATFGDHRLRLLAAAGHTAADLMILDTTTGVLFAGDIAFHDRAPTTPNADIDAWRAVLAQTRAREFAVLVPGHGPSTPDDAPLSQTGDYLAWLVDRFTQDANDGMSAAEVMFQPLPERWARLAVQPGEYRRSVSHLYPAIEQSALPERTE